MRRRVGFWVIPSSGIVLRSLFIHFLPVHLHLRRAANPNLLGAQSSRVELVGHLVVGIPRDAREAGLLVAVLAGRLGIQAARGDVAPRFAGEAGRGLLVEPLVAGAGPRRRVDTGRGAPRRAALRVVVKIRFTIPGAAGSWLRAGARLGQFTPQRSGPCGRIELDFTDHECSATAAPFYTLQRQRGRWLSPTATCGRCRQTSAFTREIYRQ